MADLFDTLRRASFGGIEFPYTDYEIKGSLRHHVHEYIKRPGGEVESLGRRAYEFSFKMRFVDAFEGYADLYPSRLSALISLCESEKAYDLWVPTMARSFKAKATSWVRGVSAAMRSGEDVTFSFIEDSTEAFTTLNLVGVRSAGLTPALAVLTTQVIELDDADALDALGTLTAEIDKWLTAVSQAQAAVDYQTARIDGVLSVCDAMASLPVFQTVDAVEANTTLLGIWSIGVQEQKNQQAASRPLLTYVTPLPIMSVLDVSLAVYGLPSFAGELLRYNNFNDALVIPRGTEVRYLAAAA